MQGSFAAFLLYAVFAGSVATDSRQSNTVALAGPVEKVVSLLQDMKTQVEKEMSEDEEAHSKRTCWCDTNKQQKDAAVEAADAKITDLEAVIESAAGTEGMLKTEIESLAEGITEDEDSLAKASALREKENEEFAAEAANSKECISTLEEALAVLSKVQLLQKDGHSKARVNPLLVQLRAAALRVPSAAFAGELGERFRSVMQQDLWDVMGAFGASGNAFMRPRKSMALIRDAALQPLEGAAAGAVSYNSRSGQILGVLAELKADFVKSLASAEAEEKAAAEEFASLKAAKEGEIASGKEQKAAKEKALAETLVTAARAKDDVATTKAELTADQQFLLDLVKTCRTSDEEYTARAKIRGEEIQALGETISILRDDDSRDLFGKSLSFLQTSSVADHGGRAKTAVRAVTSAMQRILKVARKHHNWVLASLAVHVRLDAFEKLKEVMDKMVAELKEQQKAESEKFEFCKAEIDKTEDTAKVKTNEKEDLEGTILELENSFATLKAAIETLNSEVADMKVSLKQAGENRKQTNDLFKQSISDQRATIEILNKALARLKSFYAKEFVQTSQPGVAVSPAPPAAKEYQKSAGAGGVIQLMQKIIKDATSTEAEIVLEEQHDQEAYAQIANDITASIEANNKAIVEKTKLMEETSAEKSEAEASLLSTNGELAKLDDMLKGMHLDCDFLLKYYTVRQTARAEEMDAIGEAKAILSGSDFGQN